MDVVEPGPVEQRHLMTGGFDLRSFQITLDGLTTFRNDLATRSFLSVSVDEGKHAVCDLVRAVDRAFAFLGLQTFYKVSLRPISDLLKRHYAVHTPRRISLD